MQHVRGYKLSGALVRQRCERFAVAGLARLAWAVCRSCVPLEPVTLVRGDAIGLLCNRLLLTRGSSARAIKMAVDCVSLLSASAQDHRVDVLGTHSTRCSRCRTPRASLANQSRSTRRASMGLLESKEALIRAPALPAMSRPEGIWGQMRWSSERVSATGPSLPTDELEGEIPGRAGCEQ